MRIIMLALLSLALSTSGALAKDWYIDGKSGNDNNAGTSTTTPFKTGWKAAGLAKPGDTIHVAPTVVYGPFGIMVSGTASAPITIVGSGGTSNPTQINGGGNAFGFQINSGASYIVFENFSITAPGPWNAIYIGSNSTHVTITNNVTYNSGHCGIASTHADYLTITNNTVYGNAKVTSDGITCSGISTYEDYNSDSSTAIKNIIAGNIVYDNSNTPKCSGCSDADGSGIMLDDMRHTQSDKVVYNGKTLIENNIVFNNGGRGIYTYLSDHAEIINNTVFYNNWDPYEASWRPGEIMVEGGGGDIQIYNNIAFGSGTAGNAADGAPVGISVSDATDGAGTITADYNVIYNQSANAGNMYFGGSTSHPDTNSVTFGAHNSFKNPMFMAASTSPTSANFRLQNGSPGLGVALASMKSPTDITGATRPSTFVDTGAYQQTVPPVCGAANGVLSLVAPVTGLCNVGTSSAVSLLSGLWSWTCAATDGVKASCSAKDSAPAATTISVSIIASGDDYQGDPIMGILINGTQVASSTVTAVKSSNVWQTFTYTLTVPSSFQTFGISFTNDGSGTGGDRNLYVQSVKVNGVTLSPSQGTYTHFGTSQTGGTMLWTTGTLIWNASLI